MPVLFFVFWVILNGQLTLEIALFGIAISFAVFFFSVKFLGYDIQAELRIYRRILRLLGFVGLLLFEIAKANIDVLKVIYRTKHQPNSKLVTFRVDLKSNAARVALANAITLTPGTITVFQENNRYTVHCLDESFSLGMEESSFVKYLQKTEQLFESDKQKRKGKSI